MIKKIIAASAVSCLLLPLVHAASTDKPDGWYLKGSYEDLFNSKKFNNFSVIAGSIGYKQGFLRGEGQLGYARVSEALCYQGSCTNRKNANNFNFGLHGFLDWDNQTILSPYIGLGIEKSTWRSRYYNYSNGVRGLGLIGTRAYLTSNLALDAGYKADLGHLSRGGVGSIGVAYHFE